MFVLLSVNMYFFDGVFFFAISALILHMPTTGAFRVIVASPIYPLIHLFASPPYLLIYVLSFQNFQKYDQWKINDNVCSLI